MNTNTLQFFCVFALFISFTQIVPAYADAEYAFRWNPAESGPNSVEGTLKLLKIKDEHPSIYIVKYADVRRSSILPGHVRTIVRERTKGSKVETSYKLRSDQSLPSRNSVVCLLKNATWDADELDVSWNRLNGNLNPEIAYSRTCSEENSLEKAVSADFIVEKNNCQAQMTRYHDKMLNLKFELWQMPNQTIYEVSRKVKEENSTARNEFIKQVIQPLINAGANSMTRSKTDQCK